MLTIRKPQLNTLERDFLRRFVAAALASLLRLAGPPREPLEISRACTILESARQYGLQNQQEATLFLAMAWVYGPSFDTEIPGAKEILSGDMPADGKAGYLRALLSCRLNRNRESA